MTIGIYNGILRRNKNTGSVPLFSKISSGDNFTIALGIDGSIWGWGINSFGQCGTGTTPVQVNTLTRIN